MPETVAEKRMQQRRGTSEAWASLDPVLLAGEFGLETDTGVIKIGDGAKNWSELEPVGGGAFVFESEGEEQGGDIPAGVGIGLPPSDGKYYLMKDGEWVAVEVITPPQAFAPDLTEGQDLALTMDKDMTPYVVQGANTGGE